MLILYKTIGQRIKAARNRMGLSQVELATDVEISTAYLCNVELGNKCVSLEVIIRIANALEVTTDDLLADCLKNHQKVSSSAFSKILEDCSLYESRVIIDTATDLKRALRDNRFTEKI